MYLEIYHKIEKSCILFYFVANLLYLLATQMNNYTIHKVPKSTVCVSSKEPMKRVLDMKLYRKSSDPKTNLNPSHYTHF